MWSSVERRTIWLVAIGLGWGDCSGLKQGAQCSDGGAIGLGRSDCGLKWGAVDLGWGDCGLEQGTGCSRGAPLSLGGAIVVFSGFYLLSWRKLCVRFIVDKIDVKITSY